MITQIARFFRIMRYIPSRFARLSDERGTAVVELALILGLFGPPVLLGTVEVSSLLYSSIEISNAAHAGAMYGMMSSTYAEDTSGIQTAAKQEATDFGASLTATPSIYYVCSSAISGTQYSTQTLANAACTGSGNHSLEFVQVVTSAPVVSPVVVPGFASTITVSGKSAMEVEE